MPHFSIIVPCYNRSAFLRGTITSVLMQDFKDFELLIIDDGSTDNTAQLVQEMALKDSRIFYHYKENGERGAARNFGIKKAKGELIVFLDSDDEFLQGHLTCLKEIAERYPKINLFATKFDFIEEGVVFKAPIDQLEEGYCSYEILKKGNPFACNVCVRKNNPDLILFKEERSYSGMEDWLFLFANCWSQDLFLSAKTTVRMHEHPNRSMRFNKIIIEKRLLATSYILRNFSITKAEQHEINGFSAYFCAIHSYLDNDRRATLKWTRRAISKLGLKSNLLKILFKLMFGRKIIGKIKEIVSHRKADIG